MLWNGKDVLENAADSECGDCHLPEAARLSESTFRDGKLMPFSYVDEAVTPTNDHPTNIEGPDVLGMDSVSGSFWNAVAMVLVYCEWVKSQGYCSPGVSMDINDDLRRTPPGSKQVGSTIDSMTTASDPDLMEGLGELSDMEFVEVNMAEACDGELSVCVPDAEGLEPGENITVDSGAGTSVTNPKKHPNCELKPSAASQRGQQFVGPFGATTPNQGDLNTEVVLETGDTGNMTFAGADVRKTLLSVSSVNQRGNPCWFDGDSSFIIPAGAEQLPEIRRLILAVKKKVQMHMNNGVFHIKTWKKPSRPFQGQGR